MDDRAKGSTSEESSKERDKYDYERMIFAVIGSAAINLSQADFVWLEKRIKELVSDGKEAGNV